MKVQIPSNLDALLLENPIDILYLTGLTLSKGQLVVKQKESKLFVDGRYISAARKSAPCPVEPSEGDGLQRYLHGKVGFDSAFATYARYQQLVKASPGVDWIPVSNPLKETRVCKKPAEIAALKRAAATTFAGFKHIKSLLREGVSEEEMAFEYEFYCRKNGASGLSFESIVAFGENSAYPHHRAGKTRLKKDQVVLIDVGAIVDGYRGDMTRIVFFGDVDPKILRFSEIVKRAQKMAIEAVAPGLKIGRLDEIVREVFRQENVEELFTHSLGHGIGLETHEYPRIKYNGDDSELILRPGMVFTIEPGVYQPGIGGIRYEDMILVTERGYENFFDGFEC